MIYGIAAARRAKGIRWLGLGIALAQDAKTVLQNVTKTIGDVKSIQFSGTGHLAAVGQLWGMPSPSTLPIAKPSCVVIIGRLPSSPSREVAARLQGLFE